MSSFNFNWRSEIRPATVSSRSLSPLSFTKARTSLDSSITESGFSALWSLFKKASTCSRIALACSGVSLLSNKSSSPVASVAAVSIVASTSGSPTVMFASEFSGITSVSTVVVSGISSGVTTGEGAGSSTGASSTLTTVSPLDWTVISVCGASSVTVTVVSFNFAFVSRSTASSIFFCASARRVSTSASRSVSWPSLM